MSSIPIPLIRYAVGGWTFFIVENTVLSHNRTYLISQLFSGDESLYHACYGTLSTVAMGLTFYGYRQIRGKGPFTRVGGGRLGLAFGLQALGLMGLSQLAPKLQIPYYKASSPPPISSPSQSPGPSQVPTPSSSGTVWQVRCPFDFKTPDHDSVHGVGRVSRHSTLWSFAFFSLGSAFATPAVPTALCFAMPVAVAAIGGEHQDYRYRRGMGGVLPEDVDRRTSNVPFLAMVTGRQGGIGEAFGGLFEEFKGLNAAAAASVAVGMALRRGRGR